MRRVSRLEQLHSFHLKAFFWVVVLEFLLNVTTASDCVLWTALLRVICAISLKTGFKAKQNNKTKNPQLIIPDVLWWETELSACWNFSFSSLWTSASRVDFDIPWGRRAQSWSCCNTAFCTSFKHSHGTAPKPPNLAGFGAAWTRGSQEMLLVKQAVVRGISSLLKEYFSFSQGSELASVSLVWAVCPHWMAKWEIWIGST